MYKKFNPKRLLVILVVLTVLVAILVITDYRKPERSFRSHMVGADTTRISRIVIQARFENAPVIELTRDMANWRVGAGKGTYQADQSMVNNMMQAIAGMEPLRLAGREKAQWREFEVTDSAATRVKIYTGKKLTADLRIGRFNYQEPATQQPHYAQPRGTLSTYVRLANEEEVYLVDGFLGMAFNRSLGDFRDKTVVRSDKSLWEKLTFTYPADSSFVLERTKGYWHVNGIKADSAATDDYLTKLSSLTGLTIVEDDQPLNHEAMLKLEITGKSLAAPIIIKAMPAGEAHTYLIESSMNQDALFSAAQSGVMQGLFAAAGRFVNPE